MAGFSDSHWFRKAFGAATVYGFCPQREMALFEAAPLIHGADERAAVADLELAAASTPTSAEGARMSERRRSSNGSAPAERRARCGSAGWRFATAC